METRHTSRQPTAVVVDDEPDMLEYIERVLRRRFVVTLAHSAEEALPILRSGEYDLVITDNQMAELSGLEMLAQLRDIRPALVRIVISGFADDPEIQRAIDEGIIDGYVLKPLSAHELLGSIEQAYDTRATRTG